MTLKIKHLAPYLPYKPRVLVSQNNVYQPYKLNLEGITNGDDDFYGGKIVVWTNVSGYPICGTSAPFEVKLVLRPLSDFNYRDYWGYPNKEMFYEDVNNKTVVAKLWEELLSDHIDVFGLIEKGLAVDINKLLDN